MARLLIKQAFRDRQSYQLELEAAKDETDGFVIVSSGRCPVLTSWTAKTELGSSGVLTADISIAVNQAGNPFPTSPLDWIPHGRYGRLQVTRIDERHGGDWDVDLPPFFRFTASGDADNLTMKARINLWSMEQLNLFNLAGHRIGI